MLLIQNGYIKPMTSPDLENGCVLIGDDGKIVAVGRNKQVFPHLLDLLLATNLRSNCKIRPLKQLQLCTKPECLSALSRMRR